MGKKQEKENSFTYLKFFIIVLVFSAFISIAVKVSKLVSQSELTEDVYTVFVMHKEPYLVHVDKTKEELTLVKLNDTPGGKFDRLFFGLTLEIPVDGFISFDSSSEHNSDFRNSFFKLGTIASIVRGDDDYYLEGMNAFDMWRIYAFSKKRSDAEIKNTSFADPEFSYESFRDQAIVDDNTTIEIVNGTTINGLGTSVAQMLEHIGYDVISVTTDEKIRKSKIIFYKDKKDSYAARKLSKAFSFPTESKKEPGIAKISILLGEDLHDRLD